MSALKQLLDEKYVEYCRSDFFIETDPIQIPKLFEEKEDIEIAGFMAATLAWGQRPVIIKKCRELIKRLDYAPHDFVLHAAESDYSCLKGFKHRTFNDYDCIYFFKSLSRIYKNYGGLEGLFSRAYQQHQDMFEVLAEWHTIFTALPAENRVLRHIADVEKGSAAKRINMFLRWMVRRDEIDFGLWKKIPASALLIPLDLHTGNISRQLGLLTRKQNDRQAVLELTCRLREFDPVDPIRYDFALFGLGAFEKYND
ncbi:TIGR02757 family protein [uncultured Sanguibacteroides sp.]|uniref:TIGR02757 family protein n=1 Tax=uncultured Sanguibacteroides sp. TaxID=1635151 RepID=UPI0025D2A530|nr:TIGR02757 family protein [uncultured Sanguibacteroides sp.]